MSYTPATSEPHWQQAWADADPYVAAGVYQRVDVRPFRKVLP